MLSVRLSVGMDKSEAVALFHSSLSRESLAEVGVPRWACI